MWLYGMWVYAFFCQSTWSVGLCMSLMWVYDHFYCLCGLSKEYLWYQLVSVHVMELGTHMTIILECIYLFVGINSIVCHGFMLGYGLMPSYGFIFVLYQDKKWPSGLSTRASSWNLWSLAKSCCKSMEYPVAPISSSLHSSRRLIASPSIIHSNHRWPVVSLKLTLSRMKRLTRLVTSSWSYG